MGVWVYACMCVCVYVCMGVWMYGCMRVCVYGCMGVWVYACMEYDCMDGANIITFPIQHTLSKTDGGDKTKVH